MEKQLNSSGIFRRIYIIAYSLRDPEWFAKTEHRSWKFTDRIIFMSMFNDIGWTRTKKWWNLYYEFRKSQGIWGKIIARTWTFLCPGDEKKWYGTLPNTPEGKWDSTVTQMVQRFKDTGHPEFKSINALSRGILKKKNNRDTIHFNADASNKELLFRIIHSVN